MSIRVAQWATGGVGKAAIQDVLAHPELELVGTWVHSADKHGKDVGEIIGGDPIGVLATTDQQEILDGDADCVVYSPLMPNEDEVIAILRAGKNVVTPVGWVNPDPSTTEAIRRRVRGGGSTLHGTGIHPGGITERFPLMVSALSAGVTHVRSEEFSDIRTYGAPDVIRHIMGFGATPEEARGGMIVGLLSGGFKQSVHMIVTRWASTQTPSSPRSTRSRWRRRRSSRRSGSSSPAWSRASGSAGRPRSAARSS